MNQFKELKVWQDAIDLGVEVYKLTKRFPSDEKFALVSQINRSVVSVSSNIAEGAGRNNPKEFRQFLGIALGSACELESQLVISQKLDFISPDDLSKHSAKLVHVQNMISKLIKSININ
ncbi:MAG: diversity-rating retroelement protein bAvd family protein [Bacteroidetes bacterium]|jgi:four helix bundle protein|nr:diversity-rating retroelement protein bAvd family protein [Bacteroidota bacterium]